MAKLTVFADGVSGASRVQIQYRLAGSGQAFTLVEPSPPTLPYSIPNIANGAYEIQVRKFCNGVWSDWGSGNSPACTSPAQFSASLDGNNNNFVIIYGLLATQSKIEVEVTDPNGGKTLTPYTGPSQGTFNIPVNPKVSGTYSLRARAICDDSVSPVFNSDFTPPVQIDYLQGCNPPVISNSAITTSDANTVTNRVTFSGYSSNVRVRVVNSQTGAEISNTSAQATGQVDVVLLRHAQYEIQIYNQCGSAESSKAFAIVTVGDN